MSSVQTTVRDDEYLYSLLSSDGDQPLKEHILKIGIQTFHYENRLMDKKKTRIVDTYRPKLRPVVNVLLLFVFKGNFTSNTRKLIENSIGELISNIRTRYAQIIDLFDPLAPFRSFFDIELMKDENCASYHSKAIAYNNDAILLYWLH